VVKPGEDELPSLGAGLVASLAGWMIDDLLQPYLGVGATLVLSLVASTLIFFYARRWLTHLRGR
jgi:hypothetical protein